MQIPRVSQNDASDFQLGAIAHRFLTGRPAAQFRNSSSP